MPHYAFFKKQFVPLPMPFITALVSLRASGATGTANKNKYIYSALKTTTNGYSMAAAC